MESNIGQEGVSPDIKDGEDQNQTCGTLQHLIDEKFHNEIKNTLNKSLIAEGVSDITKKYGLVTRENPKENKYF